MVGKQGGREGCGQGRGCLQQALESGGLFGSLLGHCQAYGHVAGASAGWGWGWCHFRGQWVWDVGSRARVLSDSRVAEILCD